MASNNGVPATMVIGGKTFNLAGLINESVLDLQMANVFKVLRKLNSLIETQASQIQALQTKVLEIDPLAQRVSSMHAWQESTAERLNRIEDKLTHESKETEAVKARVSELESRFTIIAQVQTEMKETNDHMDQVQKNFAQLKLDARDALQLSGDVKHFKTELQELQEDVTTVLHQAPSTERLIAQVQQNVDASTEQLMAMSSKTAFMEATMTKMSTTVDEFKHMKEDLNRRLTTLENPKIDRLGILENQSRGMAKQVSLLQHNWMTNWGAHEQSMQVLKDEVMLHIDQLRMQGAGGAASSAGDGSSGGLTFVRMDEEEKLALRKQIDQCNRDINRLDNKKADYAMVMKLLDDKADSSALTKMMEASEFEQRKRMAELNTQMARVLQEHQAANAKQPGADRPLTAGPMRSPLDQISELQLADEMYQEGLEDSIGHNVPNAKPKMQQRRPASTPPVLPGSLSGMDRGGGHARGSKTTIRYTSSGQQVAYEPMAQPLANRRLSAHDARQAAGRMSYPRQNARPPPGKIRPATASAMPGSPQIFLLGAHDSGKSKRQAVQPDPSLSLTAHSIRPVSGPGGLSGGEDYVQLSHWDVGPSPMVAAAFSPLPQTKSYDLPPGVVEAGRIPSSASVDAYVSGEAPGADHGRVQSHELDDSDGLATGGGVSDGAPPPLA